MTTDNQTTRLNGRHALLGFVAFFLIVFCANSALVYYALKTHAGVETPDAYRLGLAYNDRIAEAERQAKLGWTDNVELAGKPARVAVDMTTAYGSPVTGLRLTGFLGRPATNTHDAAITLTEERPGHYVARFERLEPGNWMVELAAMQGPPEADRVAYRIKRRLWLAP